MSDFKIIAIKTGKKPKRYFKTERTGAILDPYKILTPNFVYSFDSNYRFPQNNFEDIKKENNLNFNFYSIQTEGRQIPININAIVGANGSGKSTLIELLYWANYNIGCSLKLLKSENRGKTLAPYKFLDLEILYAVNNNEHFIIKLQDGLVTLQELLINDKNQTIPSTPFLVDDIIHLSSFFYSIVINYSHYALNAIEIGDWINPLFHKNDGYQTPIVLNPMRIDGNIDINKENRLLVRRLQANLLEDIGEQKEEDTLRNIANGKIATSLNLTYNSSHYYTPIEEPKNKEILEKLIIAIGKYFQLTVTKKQLNEDRYVNVSINYLVEKLIKISKQYKPFRRYKHKEGNKDSIKYIDAFIKKVRYSNSHIIFKVKGVILYLKYSKLIFDEDLVSLDKERNFNINELAIKITKIQKNEKFWVNTYMMAPPAFYNVNVILSDKTSLNSLSSGEKQRIHSVSSIAYHIINLNSVGKIEAKEKGEERYMNYRYLNIVLDEIELYYHPEWQRKYISDLLDYIGKVSPKNLSEIEGMNITFLTHSPYILSDIPRTNILRLIKGEVKSFKNEEKTFGANIHELMTQSFFMGSTTGEYAKKKIKEIVEFHYKVKVAERDDLEKLKESYLDKKQEFEYIVENIGEELIQGVLENHIEFIEENLFEKELTN